MKYLGINVQTPAVLGVIITPFVSQRAWIVLRASGFFS
jgi:hypothetical protein